MTPEERTATWQRPVTVRYATVIRENRVVSSIANKTDINPEPPFLDKNQERLFKVIEVGPDVKVGDILPEERAAA
jgi:hypothetical protein